MPGSRESGPGPTLLELQRRFLAAVLPPPDEAVGEGSLGELLVPAVALPAEQLQIYRRNVRENFAAALEAGYPALRASLGSEEFRALAWSFQRRHPSRSGNLQWVGQPLAAFLAEALEHTDRSHLADLARLEWAVQEVTLAADDARIPDLAALAAVPAHRHGELKLGLHPAVRLLRLAAPVFHLWQLHRGLGTDPGAPGPSPECLLVRRRDRGAEVHRLPAGEYAWLAAVAAGGALEVAVEAGLAADPSLDLSPVLVKWCQAGVITAIGLELPGPA